MTVIAVSANHQTVRIALLQGDTLTEFALWTPAAPDGVGDLYIGRVTTRVPAMAGGFVNLGTGTGFLPDTAGKVHDGDLVTVIVTRAAQGGKGPRLTLAPPPPRSPPFKPGLIHRGPGPLLELASRFSAALIRLDDYALLATLRPALEGRMTYQAITFDPVLEDEIAGLAAATAPLPGGALMHIVPTPALTAIDIDAGVATASPAGKARAQSTLNTALMPELVRQIVLRNLSGAILIDFAGMKSRARTQLLPILAHALAKDPLKPRLLGITALGFAEIFRPRIHPPLHELLAATSAPP